MSTLLDQVRAELPQLGQLSSSVAATDTQVRRNPHDDEQFIVWSQPSGGECVCMNCIERKVMLLFAAALPVSSALTLEDATALTLQIASCGVGIAVTNADTDQHWSLLAPWPQCRDCNFFPTWLTATESTLSEIGQPAPAGNGIARRRDPGDFAALHRGLFGFASVMLNPTLDSTGGIHTVDSGMFLGEPTVFAPVGGKGQSVEQALASCIGEGLERYVISGPAPSGDTESKPPADFEAAPWAGARDFDRSPALSADASFIELRRATRVGARGAALFPESLVKAPYLPSDMTHGSPTPSSTTGAAAGGSVAEASLQAIFELLERDAFWYAARTGWAIEKAESAFAQQLVSRVGDSYDVEVILGWVNNPLDIPIAHCVLQSRDPHVRMCSRGMGVALEANDAAEKAVVEAVQMWRSIATGIEVEPSETDMRSLWWSGEAREVFHGLFNPEMVGEAASREFWTHDAARAAGIDAIIEAVSEHAMERGLKFYRVILADTPGYSVVRCLSEEILPLDDCYFPRLKRFASWDALTGTARRVTYTGPLFM
ncbi:YcaO-like family protein [Microbacterium sp.]|uniref:YcaO-like family protein n=1 Tax=Microbacterium sp. TaxID=51671 RepID=UPI003A9215BC